MCKQAIELAVAVVAGRSFYVIDAASKQEIGYRSLPHHGDLSRNANKNIFFLIARPIR
jgi:hypothetical protein